MAKQGNLISRRQILGEAGVAAPGGPGEARKVQVRAEWGEQEQPTVWVPESPVRAGLAVKVVLERAVASSFPPRMSPSQAKLTTAEAALRTTGARSIFGTALEK